jgi:hypothetical protein
MVAGWSGETDVFAMSSKSLTANLIQESVKVAR